MADPLKSVVIRAPGIKGLNFEGEGITADPSYARVANNVVYDKAGRLCARKGFTPLTSTVNRLTGNPSMETLFMYDYSGGNRLITTATVSAALKIYDSADPYTALNDVTGTVTPTTNDWQWQNFNDKIVGSQAGEPMIVKSGSGNFAPIVAASGAVPTGNCVHSAFGKLWAQKANTSTGQSIISYCATLGETHWATGAGEINVLGTAGAVASGYDELVAINSVGKFLVAFLRNSIVIYSSPDDPAALGIVKIIQGVGCIARDSVQSIGGDLFFLSSSGVRSLNQTIEAENTLELGDLSAPVRRELVESARQSGNSSIKSCYFPEEAFYLLTTPDGMIWAFDLHIVGDDSPMRITQFPNTSWKSFYSHEGTLYIGETGRIGNYEGYLDDTSTYIARWESSWTDFNTSRFKILKKLTAIVEGAQGQSMTFIWTTDYGEASGGASAAISAGAALAEYGEGEYGISEYGGGFALQKLSVPASRIGEVFSFGFVITINSFNMALEQLSLFVKLGREAR